MERRFGESNYWYCVFVEGNILFLERGVTATVRRHLREGKRVCQRTVTKADSFSVEKSILQSPSNSASRESSSRTVR